MHGRAVAYATEVVDEQQLMREMITFDATNMNPACLRDM